MKDFNFDDIPDDQPIRIYQEPIPAFTLEWKYFDHLRNVNDIAIYAYCERLRYAYLEITDKSLKEFAQKIGMSKKALDKALTRLCELGFLAKGI